MGIFRNTDRKLVQCTEKEKIRVICSKEDITSLKNVSAVHLCFRPSNMDIFKLVKSCPNMKVIQVPGSYMESISASAKAIIDMRGMVLRKGTIQRMN